MQKRNHNGNKEHSERRVFIILIQSYHQQAPNTCDQLMHQEELV